MNADRKSSSSRSKPNAFGHGVVRIIGGTHRSRRIRFESAHGLRPTPDRVRETLFNWLAPRLPGARCLDLFAGSGALAFEAASRGAAHVTAVGVNPRSARRLEENRRTLGIEAMDVHCGDAISHLRHCADRFDIVFVDPPFDADASRRVLAVLRAGAVLTDNGVVYLERRAQRTQMAPNEGFRLLKSGRAGEVDFRLLEPAKTDQCDLKADGA